MILTLYKNCILQDDYNEVFYPRYMEETKGYVVDKYLNTLENISFNLTYTYTKLQGSINISYNFDNTNIYDFNYMTLYDEQHNRKIYAFITDIQLSNEYVYLSYNTDIFNTFMPEVKMRNCILANSTIVNESRPHYLPIDYTTNEKLNVNKLTDNKVNLIITMQQYDLTSSATETTNREVYTFMVPKKVTLIKDLNINKFEYSIAEAQITINEILSIQGQELFVDKLNDKHYFEITNIYVIPNILEVRQYFFENIPTEAYLEPHKIIAQKENVKYFYLFQPGSLFTYYELKRGDLITCITLHTNNDFKKISIGTLSSQIKIIRNGTDFNTDILFSYSGYDFNIFISTQGNIKNITQDFSVPIPFTSINGEVTAMRNINDTIKTAKLATGAVADIIRVRGSVGQGATTFLSSKGTAGLSQMTSGVADFINSATDTITSAWELSTDRYQNTYGAKTEGNIFTNAYNGIITLSIIPDNEEEVKIAINNIGYAVLYDLNDFFEYLKAECSYKFSFVRLYGKCPQNIINKLKSILLRGLKMRYVTDV